MTKYLVEYRWSRKPEKVDVVNQTEKTATVQRQGYTRRFNIGRREVPFIADTFEEGKAFLIDLKIKEVESARRRLEQLNGELGNMRGMVE